MANAQDIYNSQVQNIQSPCPDCGDGEIISDLEILISLLTAVEENTDGLEACCAAQTALLTDIESNTDGLEAALASQLLVLNDIDTNTDGIEALLTSVNLSVQALETDIVLAGGDNNIGNVDIASTPTGASATQVQGTAADAAAPVGNPLGPIAGYDSSGAVQRRVLVDSLGQLRVAIYNSSGSQSALLVNNADSHSAATVGQVSSSFQYAFNGNGWDRIRNNVIATPLSSASRSATTASAAQTNYNNLGLFIFLDVTVAGGGTISQIDILASGQGGDSIIYSFTGLAISTTGQRVFLVYPGAATAGLFTAAAQQGIIPRDYKVQVVQNASPITYSLRTVLMV